MCNYILDNKEIAIFGIIFTLILRYILMCLAIKNKSKLFQKTKELNDKYKNQFNTFKKEINIHNRCNTLIKYKSSCNRHYKKQYSKFYAIFDTLIFCLVPKHNILPPKIILFEAYLYASNSTSLLSIHLKKFIIVVSVVLSSRR